MHKRAIDNPKITMITDTVVKTWLGEDAVLSGAILQNSNGTEYQV